MHSTLPLVTRYVALPREVSEKGMGIQKEKSMMEVSKEQYLEQVFDRIARTADSRGRRIDLGIMGVVLYLQVHGIQTISSCEGHLDHGHPYPWVMCPLNEQDCLLALVMRFGRSLVVDSEMVEDVVILRPRITQTEQLTANQQEIQRFAEWLRDRFFE